MIAISDTSPLTNLAAIHQFDLLRQLYREVVIPPAVWAELNVSGGFWPGRNEVAGAAWIRQQRPTNQALVTALRQDLDFGEAEAIALALELAAELILLDEQKGRRAAQRLGLNTVGVVGILLEAKARGFIDTIKPHLLALRQEAGFYLSERLYETALQLASESDS